MTAPRSLTLAAAAVLAAAVFAAPSAAQEADHLACIKVKDLGTMPPDAPIPVAISDILGDAFGECAIKKAKMVSLCTPVVNTAVNGGNDPRAGASAADAYGCYKVKCKVGKPDGTAAADDAVAGNRLVGGTKLLTLCVPVDLP
jgi:hypothetical protein